MWLLLSAVVTASLMGSLHCVGMCGPLALWAAGVDRKASSSSLWLSTALYHLGRGVTYTLAGVIAGGLGQLLDWSGGAVGIHLLAARVVGGLMILVGAVSAARIIRPLLLKSGQPRRSQASSPQPQSVTEVNARMSTTYQPPKPDWITSQLLKLRPAIFKMPVGIRGFMVGLLTALLPCGWLYLFALLAAGTGSLKLGALVMAAFWLGSIPLLVGLVAGTRLLGGKAGRLLPFAASLLLVIAGAYTASGRGFASLSSGLNASSVLLDQLSKGVPAEAIQADVVRSGIEQLVATPLPCCENRLTNKQANTIDNADDSIKKSLELQQDMPLAEGPLP